MRLVEQITHLAERYADATNLSLARISTIVFNDGKILQRLSSGGDLTTGRYERAVNWFSENWPEKAKWPEFVPRPTAIKNENEFAFMEAEA